MKNQFLMDKKICESKNIAVVQTTLRSGGFYSTKAA